MKIRTFILSIILILACVGAVKAQDIITMTIYLNGPDTQVIGSNLSTVFGDDFDASYNIKVFNESLDNQPLETSSLNFYLTDQGGNTQGPIKVDDIKKLPAGEYKVLIKCQGSIVNNNYTLTVKKRPITFISQHSAVFHCMYNGGRTFKLADYDDGTGIDAGKQLWYTAYEINNLASFDESTQIDFDNTVFEFSSPEASETMKGGTIHWALKADPNKSDDWTANYTCQNPNTNEVCECENAFDGYIHNKCPYSISWTRDGVSVAGDVELTYGDAVKSAQTFYGFEATPSESDDLKIGCSVDGGYIFKDEDKVDFYNRDYLPVLKSGDEVSSYVLRAVSTNNDACKSLITVKVSPLEITPTLGEGDIETVKDFDDNNSVVSYEDCAKPVPAFLRGDDVVISVTSATYKYKYVDIEHGNPIEIEYVLEGDDSNNYSLKYYSEEKDGSIKPIKPVIVWKYRNSDCEDQTAQTIEYGETISVISASTDFDYQQHYYPFEYKLTNADGEEIDLGSTLYSGHTYSLNVNLAVNDDVYKGSLLEVNSEIKVTVKKGILNLVWDGAESINENRLEFEYGASVGKELKYSVNNVPDNQKDAIAYTYYISDNPAISDDELFTDAYKATDGDKPSVGEYKLGCEAVDNNEYMDKKRTSDVINIVKSSKLVMIDPPKIVVEKDYDGNYYAEVKTPARYSDLEFETKAYYVDNSYNNSVEYFSESDFRKDASDYYSVYYYPNIPKEVTDNLNLCLSIDYDSEGNVVNHVLYEPGAYCYYLPGSIKCVDPVFDINIPDNPVYGDCVLGGENPTDVMIFTMLNDNIVSVDGELEFSDFAQHRVYEPRTLLDAGSYTLNGWLTSTNINFCDAAIDEFTFIVNPRPLTFDGELVIADKTYDGTDKINSNGVVTTFANGIVDANKLNEYFPENQQIKRVPSVEGIISQDLGKISVVWDYSNTKYSGSDVKYTDDTELEVAAYENIPVGVRLESLKDEDSRLLKNYQLPQEVIYGSSKIMPENPVEIVFKYDSPEPPIADLTYRLMYGKSVMGVDFKLKDECLQEGWYARYVLNSEDCTFKMMSPKENADDYYTFEVQIIKGDREQDAANNTYKVLGRQSVRIYVDKYKLQVSTPNIVTQKEYDGNTSVAWTNGNNCEITNYVDGDDVALDGEPVIEYDTPEVGTGKTITATYTLKGNDLYKYLLPDNYTTTGSITKEEVNPPDPPDPPNPPDPPIPGKIVVADVTPVSGRGSGSTLSPNEDGYCSGEKITMSIQISEGAPVGCIIAFDDNAKKAGFKDIDNGELVAMGSGLYQHSFDCPGATYGKYGGKISLIDADGDRSNDFAFEIQVNYSSKYLKSKFNDVVLVDNHEQPRLFNESNPDVTYQWYVREDGVDRIIDGETKQFYNVTTFDAWYGAFAIASGGEKVKICPRYFGKSLSKSYVERSVTVYPNPAASMQPVTIRLNDFDSDCYDGVIIYVYNSTGSLVRTLENVDELNTVILPAGSYSGVVVYEGKKISFKFIVRN